MVQFQDHDIDWVLGMTAKGRYNVMFDTKHKALFLVINDKDLLGWSAAHGDIICFAKLVKIFNLLCLLLHRV